MNRSFRDFRYLFDPLFLFCFILYIVNRWVIKPNCDFWFFHWYLNDLICIPFLLPGMLLLLRLLRLRGYSGPPRIWEIAIPLVLISLAFEVFLPCMDRFRNVTVSDPFDVIAYFTGAVLSWRFWLFWYKNEKIQNG